jgi:hypothetical protein
MPDAAPLACPSSAPALQRLLSSALHAVRSRTRRHVAPAPAYATAPPWLSHSRARHQPCLQRPPRATARSGLLAPSPRTPTAARVPYSGAIRPAHALYSAAHARVPHAWPASALEPARSHAALRTPPVLAVRPRASTSRPRSALSPLCLGLAHA